MDEPILSPATPDSADAPTNADNGAPVNTPTPTPQEASPAESAAPQPPAADDRQKAGDDAPILEPEEAKDEVSELAGAPENYDDFTMPEGFTLDENGKAEASELFRKLNLSQKGAQTLVDAWIEKATAMKEAELNQLADQRKAWRGEIRNRPTFAADRALAQKGINAVVKTEAERALFQDTWLSDHPAVFSLFVRIGSLVGEDSPGLSGKEQTEQNVNRLRFPIN
jgi:hypothetical protein